MNLKNNITEIKEKEVYLDFDGAINELRRRGRQVNLESTAKEIGYTEPGLRKLRNKAPKSVEMLYKYLKENMLRFEDVVKER
jgi:hypothetical protein